VLDVTFRLLGSPTIRLVSADVSLRPERRFQLLAYLGTRCSWIGRDELAHLFWPDRDNATARRNLRWLLHSLQESGPFGGLEIERERVRLNLQTDLGAFERALTDRDWTEAIALYRGQFLEGMDGAEVGPFSQWLQSVRTRTADGFRNAVLKWIGEQPEDHGQHEVLAQRLLLQDPFDERALAIALQALIATGQLDVAQRRYREFAQRLLDEMGLEPGPELRALAHRWSVAASAHPARRRDPEVAPFHDSFVGRMAELAKLMALLEDAGSRLITILGPGGVGKSRLVAELAARRGALAPVALESLSLPAQIAPAVATAIGVPVETTEAEVAVAARLRESGGLLVLDNFEHLIDGAKVLAQWLQACPRLQIVVTSRERLEIAEEREFFLEGLAIPPRGMPIAQAAACDAVRLFVDRASRSKAGFDFARERAGVERIVALVDGLPLALELAAAWTRLLPCDAIAADLQSGIDLLVDDAGERRNEHRSLRACLEHSWGLLLPRERDVLAKLAVFRGDFALPAARAIADAALPALASLVDKSLLRTNGEGRFSLHPLVLRFAEERLRASDSALSETRGRHAALYLELLARSEREIVTGQQTVAGIELEIGNCFAAWWWAVDAKRFDLLGPAAEAFGFFFERRGRMREGLDLYERTGEAPGFALAPLQLHAPVRRRRAVFLMRRGQRAEAERHAYEALRCYRSLRDGAGIRDCLNLLGMLAWQEGRYVRARRYFEEGAKRAPPDSREAWRFVCNLALATQSCGDYVEARALFEKAAAIARRRADLSDLAPTLNNLGNLCIALAQPEDARRYLLEALALSQQTGARLGQPYTLVNLAIIDIDLGQFARAREYLDQAFALVKEGADRQVEPMCLYTLARIESVAGRFTSARELLADAAQIAVATENVPNMIEVALWAADNYGREGNQALAVTMLAGLIDHPAASRNERATARKLFDDYSGQIDGSALTDARARAADESLSMSMSRVIAAGRGTPMHQEPQPQPGGILLAP